MHGSIDELQDKTQRLQERDDQDRQPRETGQDRDNAFCRVESLESGRRSNRLVSAPDKAFFANEQIDRALAKLESSNPIKDKELSGWMNYTWMIEIPQADFDSLGKAIAGLENTEPLLSVTNIKIRALPDTPQFQQVALTASTIIQNR